MNHQEAIKVIKSNYPPESYTQLRDALDLAIKLLSEQPKEITVTTDGGELIASISSEDDNAIVRNGYKVTRSDKPVKFDKETLKPIFTQGGEDDALVP